MVGRTGLEPVRPKAADFESASATNYDILPLCTLYSSLLKC